MRFQILFSSLFIKIVAFAVNNDYKGHIFYVKLTESFCAQILVCDKLRFFDTFGKKGAGTADGSEVNTVILGCRCTALIRLSCISAPVLSLW